MNMTVASLQPEDAWSRWRAKHTPSYSYSSNNFCLGVLGALVARPHCPSLTQAPALRPMRRHGAHCVNCSDTPGGRNMERNSSSVYCSWREGGVPQASSSISDLQVASGLVERWAHCSGASFSCRLCSPWAPFYLILETSISRGFT